MIRSGTLRRSDRVRLATLYRADPITTAESQPDAHAKPASELLRSIGHSQVERIHSDDRDIAHSSRVITPHRIQLMALRTGRDSNRPCPGIP